MNPKAIVSPIVSVLLIAIGFYVARSPKSGVSKTSEAPVQKVGIIGSPTCCEVISTRHSGEGELDRQIRQWQSRLTNRPNDIAIIERIGWLYVSKARQSHDAGFYQLADQAGQCIERTVPGSAPGLLLRGHALHNLHRFHEARPLAEKLVLMRGIPMDHGLMGDVCLEIGELELAIEAYQKMMDLQPGPQAYIRGAQVRWFTGDLDGAMELVGKAARTGAQDRETASWALVKLAGWQLISGNVAGSARSALAALELNPGSAAAHAMLGRARLTQGDTESAMAELQRADAIQSLPETRWALVEAYRQGGRAGDADALALRISREGELQDRRGTALFLASGGLETGRAVELARQELAERADIHTHDTLGWAYYAAGDLERADEHSRLAVRHGTTDPRIHFHAALIAHRRGDRERAALHGEKAVEHISGLLPSEAEALVLGLPGPASASTPVPQPASAAESLSSPAP